MGMDIHMHIVQNGNTIKENIFGGRNREWFNNLQNKGYDYEYEHLPTEWGVSPQAPKEYMEYQKDNYYFGFFLYICKGL